MTAPRAPHVLPASQHEPGAGSGSVSRQSSPQPCQGDNLGHICPGKGLKGSSQVWFPSGKTPSFIDCSYPQLGVHWRGSAPQGTLQKWDIYPEQTSGLKGVVPVLAGSFLVHHLSSHFFNISKQAFPLPAHPQVSVALGIQVPHTQGSNGGCCTSRVQRAKLECSSHP